MTHTSGIEITRLPFSETTQKMFDLAKEMRENMDKALIANNPRPTVDILALHRQQVEENMRGFMEQIYKAVAVECPAVLISFKGDELKCREISQEELYIQPIEEEKLDE